MDGAAREYYWTSQGPIGRSGEGLTASAPTKCPRKLRCVGASSQQGGACGESWLFCLHCHASKSSMLFTVAAIGEMPGHLAVSRQPFKAGAGRRRHAQVASNTTQVLCKPHALRIEGEYIVRPDIVPTSRWIAKTEGERRLGSGTSGEIKLQLHFTCTVSSRPGWSSSDTSSRKKQPRACPRSARRRLNVGRPTFALCHHTLFSE